MYNLRVHKEKILLTAGLLLSMLLLGVVDAALLEGWPMTEEAGDIAQLPETETPAQPQIREGTGTSIIPGQGVRRNDGPDILTTLVSRGFTFQDPPSGERIVLSRVITDGKTPVTSKVLLQDGDRAGVISWVQSPDVKRHYLSLKDLLHASFTTKVKDLIDETQRREGHPVRNLLTFFDAGLLPERVVFIRVRERLLEFHIAEGKADVMFDVIEELTQ